jgi:hypothetical protein
MSASLDCWVKPGYPIIGVLWKRRGEEEKISVRSGVISFRTFSKLVLNPNSPSSYSVLVTVHSPAIYL